MKFWITLIVLTLLSAPLAFAGDDERSTDRLSANAEKPQATKDFDNIVAVLSHYHELPTRQQLEKVTDDAQQIVFELARDEETFLFHRQRAIRALAHWPTEEVYTYLVELLEADSTEDGLRHHILPVLADGFGERALENLTPILSEASDPHIRISAAGAISSIPGDQAHRVLADALKNETNPIVLSRLEKYSLRVR